MLRHEKTITSASSSRTVRVSSFPIDRSALQQHFDANDLRRRGPLIRRRMDENFNTTMQSFSLRKYSSTKKERRMGVHSSRKPADR
jgi:hypothetical protein